MVCPNLIGRLKRNADFGNEHTVLFGIPWCRGSSIQTHTSQTVADNGMGWDPGPWETNYDKNPLHKSSSQVYTSISVGFPMHISHGYIWLQEDLSICGNPWMSLQVAPANSTNSTSAVWFISFISHPRQPFLRAVTAREPDQGRSCKRHPKIRKSEHGKLGMKPSLIKYCIITYIYMLEHVV